MHLLADASMPLVEQLTDQLRQQGVALSLSLFEGRQPTEQQLAAADLLMIRSVTQVNTTLLRQAPGLQWIGTATIGTEHVDTAACAAAGVAFASTPGVNANAVGDYVAAAVSAFALQRGALPAGEVAIIGAGHTGQAAAQRLQGLGLSVHFYDPPLLAAGRTDVHADWQRVLGSAVISCHVPLTLEGEHATVHLLDEQAIQVLPPDCLLINASRGAVVAEQGLRLAKQRQQALHVVLDVWEHEPDIAVDLLAWLFIATPHIAGHSVAGKVAGTLRLFEHLSAFLGPLQLPSLSEVLQAWPQLQNKKSWVSQQAPSWQTLASWVCDIYDIRQDDKLLRQQPSSAANFDRLRKNYAARAELSVGEIVGREWVLQPDWQQRLEGLSFTSRCAN